MFITNLGGQIIYEVLKWLIYRIIVRTIPAKMFKTFNHFHLFLIHNIYLASTLSYADI